MSGTEAGPSGASFLWEPAGVRKINAPELFSEDQREIARAARKFAAGEIMPRIAQIESKKSGLVPELLRKAGELGLLMVDIPEEYGGLGLDKTTSMMIAEEFSVLGSFAVSLGAHTGIGTMPILYFGTPEQKAKYLPDLATGQKFAAYALTEPSSGSDALAAKTRADLSSDGSHYLLNGTKQFITNAGFADVFTVFAQVGGTKFSAFIVDRTSPGLTVGPEEHKLGIRGSSTCSLSFEDVKVPAGNLLGEIGKGHRIAFNILNVGRIKLGLGTIGAAKCALEVSAKYAKERHQFNKPIGAFGLVASKLAEMAIGIFVGESMGYRTTGLIDDRFAATSGEDAHVDAIEEFAVEASIIKVYGSEVLDYCADECVQIHGGYGFIEEFAPERLLRDSRINRIFEGTNEINRLIVPATILKRAMKGQAPLIERAAFIRAALAKNEIPTAAEADQGEFGVATQVVEFCKWIATYVLAVAAETFHVHIADEQEILGELSDIISHVYALDTAVARVKQIVTDGHNEMNKAVARDLLAAFAPPAYSFCVHTARHILMDVCDAATLPGHLEAIGKLRIDWPSKVIAAKRRIARAVLEADGYPIQRV
jgi:alkylation response protein AidB-like acyl-CoA dehydrogenase